MTVLLALGLFALAAATLISLADSALRLIDAFSRENLDAA